MEYQRVYVRPNTLFLNYMPYSEVCMHMRIAGKPMACKLVGDRPMVQLYDITTREPFSFPITAGEAGLYTDSDGEHYMVREVC